MIDVVERELVRRIGVGGRRGIRRAGGLEYSVRVVGTAQLALRQANDA